MNALSRPCFVHIVYFMNKGHRSQLSVLFTSSLSFYKLMSSKLAATMDDGLCLRVPYYLVNVILILHKAGRSEAEVKL